MANQSTPMRAPWGDIAPRLTEITDTVLFDDVWKRPGLGPRDRSLITVAAVVAMYRPEELPAQLRRARDNGVTRDELAALITHVAFYAGFPAAISASAAAHATPSGTASLMSPPPMPRPTSRYHPGHSSPHARDGCHKQAAKAATAGGPVRASGNLRSRMSKTHSSTDHARKTAPAA